MSYIKLKEIANIHFPELRKDIEGDLIKTISPAGLQEDNFIEIKEERIKKESFRKTQPLSVNDIIVKRISPAFVNIIEGLQEETYLINNLIGIQVTGEKYYPPYIAFTIEQQLERLNEEAPKGGIYTAINRQALEEVIIYDIPIQEQKKIGGLWLLQNKRNQLLKKLLEKEKIKSKIVGKQLLKTMEEK